MKLASSRLKTARGFSLLEILIVVTIMGILTAVVAPRLNQYIEDANITATNQELLAIKNALISIKNKTSPAVFPRRLGAVKPYLDNATFAPNGEMLDPWDNPYQYKTFPSGGLPRQRFRIASAGPDGIFGSNAANNNRQDDIVLEEGKLSAGNAYGEDDNAFEEEFQ